MRLADLSNCWHPIILVSAELRKAALAVGAALSPTSLGFSAQLLGEVGQLATPIGQLICTAAVVDDVLSLLLLAEVQALGDDNPKVRGGKPILHSEQDRCSSLCTRGMPAV